MKTSRTIIVLMLGAALTIAPAAQSQAQGEAKGESKKQPQEQGITAAEFRERMIEWAIVSERAYAPGEDLAVKIASLSEEQVEGWLETIRDPEQFLDSMARVVQLQREQQTLEGLSPEAAAPVPQSPVPPLTTPFSPDYPPSTGPYADTILNAIDVYGLGPASNVNRCDAATWGNYIGVWWPLNETFDALDGACVVAGCDPIGIGCAITCGILEAAKVALKIAAVPLEACDVHQSAIDGAEIEATYENTLGLVGDVAHLHSDLDAHDTNIDGDLAAHDANIDGDLAAHDANIDGDLVAHDANIDADLAAHDANIDGDLVQHDADIKELLEDLQGAVDENQRLIKITMARQLEIMRLLITPSGRRSVNPDVLNCTGDDCPEYPALQLCPDGSLDWNCGE